MSDAVKRRAHLTAHLRVYAEAGRWTVRIEDDHHRLVFERPVRYVPGTQDKIVVRIDDEGKILFAELFRITPQPVKPSFLVLALGRDQPNKRAHVLAWLH